MSKKFNNKEIKEIIPINEVYDENDTLCKITDSETNTIYNVKPFTNEFPLILDEVKKYFYLIKTRYVLSNIKNKTYLIYKNENEFKLNDIKDKQFLFDNFCIYENVKRIILFNWIMNVKYGYSLSFENNILIKTSNPLITKLEECKSILYVYTCNETDFTFNEQSAWNRNFEVPKNMLNKWFKGSLEEFYKEAKNLIGGMDADLFRSKFSDIVNYYNNDYISWVNVAYERFRFIKNL